MMRGLLRPPCTSSDQVASGNPLKLNDKEYSQARSKHTSIIYKLISVLSLKIKKNIMTTVGFNNTCNFIILQHF